MGRRSFFGSWIGGMALLAACGGGGGGGGGNMAPPADPQATHKVGPAGATIASPDGSLALTIPAGALAAETDIGIVEISAANLPERPKALGAERVYRLSPDGLQFAQPVAVQVTLPASDTLAVMILDSRGQAEPVGNGSVTFGGGARTLGGTIGHFSDLVVKNVDVKLEVTVDKRQLQVGQFLTASVALSKTASEDEFKVVSAEPHHGGPFTRFGTIDWRNITFPRGEAKRLTGTYDLRCDAPGQGWAGIEVEVKDITIQVIQMLYIIVAGSSFDIQAFVEKGAFTDIVCDPAGAGPGNSVRTGLFPLPFAVAPDGLTLVRGPMAHLPQADPPYLGIAAANGFVAIDPVTGLSALNMTDSGADGPLGNNLLGVVAASARPGGPTAAATLFGFNSFLWSNRNWDPQGLAWGLTLVGTNHPVLDAEPVEAPAATAADRVIVTSPTRGIDVLRLTPDLGFQFDPAARFSVAALGGTAPRSAVQPFVSVEDIVAVLGRSSSGPPRDVVGVHDRRAVPPWQELFTLPADSGRRLRCTTLGLASGTSALCGVTSGASLHLFKLDAASNSPPARVELAVGAGALGLAFVLHPNGLPRAVVANFDDNSVNVVDFDAQGTVTGNEKVTAPDGCRKTPHPVAFVHSGKCYIALTCNATDNYWVFERL